MHAARPSPPPPHLRPGPDADEGDDLALTNAIFRAARVGDVPALALLAEIPVAEAEVAAAACARFLAADTAALSTAVDEARRKSTTPTR